MIPWQRPDGGKLSVKCDDLYTIAITGPPDDGPLGLSARYRHQNIRLDSLGQATMMLARLRHPYRRGQRTEADRCFNSIAMLSRSVADSVRINGG
jgi:hypothetical protein